MRTCWGSCNGASKRRRRKRVVGRQFIVPDRKERGAETCVAPAALKERRKVPKRTDPAGPLRRDHGLREDTVDKIQTTRFGRDGKTGAARLRRRCLQEQQPERRGPVAARLGTT